MLQTFLRGCIALVGAVLGAIVLVLVREAKWQPGFAIASVLAGVLVLSLLLILVAYQLAHPALEAAGAVSEQGRRARFGRAGLALEWLVSLAAFVLIMPFEHWWMGDDVLGPGLAGRNPVLLVPGYLCNRGIWWWMCRRLRRHGWVVATISLEPPFGGIDDFVDQLHKRIDDVLSRTESDRVALVAHSMGGLVCRAYLQRYGADRVAKLITLASPHQGTWMARFALGENGRQMRPQSRWLRDLAAAEAGRPAAVPILTIWSTDDELIRPQRSSRLPAAQEKVVSGVGHLSMAWSRQVLPAVVTQLSDREC